MDPRGGVRQIYWLQAEELLPDKPGDYDYTSDSLRMVNGLPWWVNLRAMNGPVQPGSDRAAMTDYLTAHGYRVPAFAPRLRLVYVPEPRGRREFMVVYLESQEAAGPDTSFQATLTRAKRGMTFGMCR